MTWLANQQEGRIPYDMVQKLKAMDPARAAAYKKEKWDQYQISRIKSDISTFKREFDDRVTKDPDNRAEYVRDMRNKIAGIPGLDLYEQFKDVLEIIDGDEEITQVKEKLAIDPTIVQPGMDELSADDDEDEETPVAPTEEAPVDETTSEEAERAAMDAKIDGEAELPADPAAEITEETPVAPTEEAPVETVDFVALQAKYKEAYGADVPNKYKNNAEWIEGRIQMAK